MKRCWLLEPLKDKVIAGDQFVCRDMEGSLPLGAKNLMLSTFATAMHGLPVPEGWIALRPMRNRKRRKRGFIETVIATARWLSCQII